MALSAISSANQSTFVVVPQESSFQWTSAKIQKVALGVIATLAICGGATAISLAVIASVAAVVPVGIGVAIGFIALPCFVGAGFAIWGIWRTKDYQDPVELSAYRAAACIKPLNVIAHEHGWSNMFLYGIPTPEMFSARYRELVESQSLNTALGTYNEVQKEYNAYLQVGGALRYTIPQPSELYGKWEREIAGKTACEILNVFDVEYLVRQGVLNNGSRQVAALRVAKGTLTAAENESRARETQIEAEYQRQIAPHKASLDQVRRAAEAARKAQNELDWEIFRRENEHISDLNRNPQDRIVRQRIHSDNFARFLRSRPTSADGLIREAELLFNQNTAAFKQAADQQRQASTTQFNQACTQINETYRRSL